MKRKIAIGILSIAGGILLSSKAFAQPDFPTEAINVTQFNPQFFMSILAGVLLALGFQLVLTNLSVAAGISVVGNLEDLGKGKKEDRKEIQKKHNEKKSTSLSVKIMSGGGVWGIITSAISLFFASFFAVKLSLVPNNAIGFTLGLVIWSVFFMVVLYLETRAISSVMGSFFSIAVNLVKSGYAGLASVFRKSDTAKAEEVVEDVKDGVADFVDNSDLKSNLESFVKKLAPKGLDLDNMKDELASLLNEIKIEEKEGAEPGEKDFFLRIAEKQPRFSKSDVKKIGGVLAEIAKDALKVVGAVGSVAGAAGILSQTPPVQRLKEQVEDYLRRTGEPELKPELVKAEIEEIFRDPSSAIDIIKNKAKAFDKETVVSLVAAKQGVSRDEAQRVAEKLEEAINTILRKANIAEMTSNKVQDVKEGVSEKINLVNDSLVSGVEDRVRGFLDRVDRPELEYDLLKNEFEFMLHNPKLAPEVLRRKIKQFDSGTLVALLSANDMLSKTDVQLVVDKFEEAKANVLARIDRAEEEVKRKAEQAREFALREAEETREAAVAASWWLFGTFVISGIAAAIGGMLAL